jgi:hypothetical protein
MFAPTEFNSLTDSAMKALILHDDFTSAAKAEATLQRAITRADVAVRWTVNSVPINALRQPAAAERILVEALDAHLIVFAGKCAQLLPLCVYQWLEQWVDMRRVPDAGLAVMDNERQFSFGDVAREVSPLASKHQLTFIIDESAAPANRAKLSICGTLEEGFPVFVAQRPVADWHRSRSISDGSIKDVTPQREEKRTCSCKAKLRLRHEQEPNK